MELISQQQPSTMHTPVVAPSTYEEVEQELAVCKLVLYNTYTADVRASVRDTQPLAMLSVGMPHDVSTQVLNDLLNMYGSLLLPHTGNSTAGRDGETKPRSETPRPPSACHGSSTSGHSMPLAAKVDACTQTDARRRDLNFVGAPASDELRWDLMFYHPDKEAAFLSALHSVSSSTDVLCCLMLLALLAAAAFRQADSVHTLQRVFVAMLVAVASVAGAGTLGPCRRWYAANREALVVAVRVMLALFALPAGQVLLGRQQQPINVLTSIALWAVPALMLRVRFSVHIVVHLALLSAMLTTASCQHALAGGPLLPLCAQTAALVTVGFLLPTCTVYWTELRQRRRGVLVTLPLNNTNTAKAQKAVW